MLYSVLRRAHTILAYLFFLTFIAHFGAILFHTLIVRDGILKRMAPWNIRPQEAANWLKAGRGNPLLRVADFSYSRQARITLCGLISEYNDSGARPGPDLRNVLTRRIRRWALTSSITAIVALFKRISDECMIAKTRSCNCWFCNCSLRFSSWPNRSCGSKRLRMTF